MLIYLEKQESLYDILKKIKASTEEGLELVVPEYAYLSKNSLNFKIIKEATLSYKKKLHIVTTDKIVEKLAKKDGIRVSEKPLSKEKVHWENYSDTEAEKIAEATESEKNKEIVEAKSEEIIFTRNTTESLNLLAYSLGRKIVETDDEPRTEDIYEEGDDNEGIIEGLAPTDTQDRIIYYGLIVHSDPKAEVAKAAGVTIRKTGYMKKRIIKTIRSNMGVTI
ncbi:MAG: Cysteine desulfurase [candidate division CPR3 bacterium GW2011_GWE2_35_7]|nr:MAG: Cysteine desulfurase [candidate division CPR3 bacterium GW2011_GWE2_35_7]